MQWHIFLKKVVKVVTFKVTLYIIEKISTIESMKIIRIYRVIKWKCETTYC